MIIARLLTASLIFYPLFAAEPPVTHITTPAKLIVATPFDQDTKPVRKGPINGWRAGIGEWQVKNGVLIGKELPADKHASSCTYRFEATDLIITAEFKLGSAPQVAFACRDNIDNNKHIGRTYITKTGIRITHMTGIGKTTTNKKLAELKKPIDPEKWHRLTIEISGDHYRAQVDDHVVEGRHPRYQATKNIVALINKGEGAQFRNVALWHAKPKS